MDEQLFYELVRDKKSNAMIDGFRQSGNAELKRKLPAFIFQAMFDETTSKSGKKGAWRKQSATKLTGLVVLDIDHVENPLELIEEWKKKFDFDKLGILFIYITPSGKGIKVVFKANLAWGNLADNQIEMAKLLGVNYLLMKTKNLLRNTMLSIAMGLVLLLTILMMGIVSMMKIILLPLQQVGRLLTRADRWLQLKWEN